MNALELVRLAKRINGREETLESLGERTVCAANEWLAEVKLQGHDLLAAREACKYGTWMDWLKSNCPRLSYWKATRYMTAAANLARVQNLDGVGSLRQALALCHEPDEKKSDRKAWPAYIEAIGRAERFISYVERMPITSWPQESVDKLRQQIEPVARELWPDKFQSHAQ